MKILRNNNSMPGVLEGLQLFMYNVTASGGAQTVTIETHSTVYNTIAIQVNGTILIPTIASSTAYIGTQKVSYTINNAQTAQIFIWCSDNSYTDVQTINTATTIDDVEIY